MPLQNARRYFCAKDFFNSIGHGRPSGQGAPSVRSTSSTGNILSPPALTLRAKRRHASGSAECPACNNGQSDTLFRAGHLKMELISI